MTAPSLLGLVLALAGTLLAWLRATRMPELPEIVPVVLIVTALGLMGLGIVRRVGAYRAHRRGR